jgi:hypothetical protein
MALGERRFVAFLNRVEGVVDAAGPLRVGPGTDSRTMRRTAGSDRKRKPTTPAHQGLHAPDRRVERAAEILHDRMLQVTHPQNVSAGVSSQGTAG